MAFRFVHTADVHLDSPLSTLALRDPMLAELIGGATRKAFVAVIDLCLSEQVDALLIAGDLYDGEQTSMKTARFLADQLRRLHVAGIATFVIRGNHDAESRITQGADLARVGQGLRWPRGSRGAHPRRARGGGAWRELRAQARPESLLPKFRAPIPGSVNIGMLHTSLGGSPAHDRYAPCAPAELHGADFDHWALGHIHQRFVDVGRATIVMPGNPQGRDINEAGPKSATLVTIGDDRKIKVEERLTSVAEFERVRVDLGGVEDWREGLARIEKGLAAARAAAPSEHLVARLKLDWRNAARLAAALGRRQARGGRAPDRGRARQDLDRQDRTRLRRAARERQRPVERSDRRAARADGDGGRAVEGVSGRVARSRRGNAKPVAARLRATTCSAGTRKSLRASFARIAREGR